MPKQFTVKLTNQPGALAGLAEALASRGVDIRSVGVAVVGSEGYTVITTNDDATTHDVLREHKYEFEEGDIVTAFIEDRPGSLARTTRKLADAGINIRGVLMMGRHQGKVELAFAVDNTQKAKRALGVS